MNDINILKNNGVDLDASLELLGDMEMYDETLAAYLSSIAEKVNNLAKYRNDKDMPNYAILVHSLKSDSKYLGFTHLAELALNHEMESKNNNQEYVDNHFEELILEVKRVIQVAIDYLKVIPKKEETNETVDTEGRDAILVVDDSDMVLNFISKVFNNTFNVILASDGNKAIMELSKENNIKCVLLDLNMPNVNGFEVLDYLKTNDLFTKYPVSIITGADDKSTITKAFNYQIVDMLQKPFNERDVKRIVERTMSYGK